MRARWERVLFSKVHEGERALQIVGETQAGEIKKRQCGFRRERKWMSS